MSAAAKTCASCGERYWNTGAHAERCRGPRLRQPTYEPWDWAGLMADDDTDRLRANGGHDHTPDAGIPWERRH